MQEAKKGHGFCWTCARFDADASTVEVDGCYWACPYETVVYDFSKPRKQPYKELSRIPYAYPDDEDDDE